VARAGAAPSLARRTACRVAAARPSRRSAVSVVSYLTEHAPIAYKDLAIGAHRSNQHDRAPPARNRLRSACAALLAPSPHARPPHVRLPHAGVPRESAENERRVSLTPAGVQTLLKQVRARAPRPRAPPDRSTPCPTRCAAAPPPAPRQPLARPPPPLCPAAGRQRFLSAVPPRPRRAATLPRAPHAALSALL
jgi:hypothetical protein